MLNFRLVLFYLPFSSYKLFYSFSSVLLVSITSCISINVENGMLKIDPSDVSVLVGVKVQTIQAIDPAIKYSLDYIDIPFGSGVKLSEVNFQAFKDLRRVETLTYISIA